MMTRPTPRAYFYRNGQELTAHACNGRPLVGFGVITGRVGNAVCFHSVTVRTNINDELTERDFGGEPVMIKVWSPESKPVWFGIARVETVEGINEERHEACRRSC